MLLSDQLLEIGRKSNPRNNLSMAEASLKMLKILEKSGKSNIEQAGIMKYVFKTLAKEGYPGFGFILNETMSVINNSKSVK